MNIKKDKMKRILLLFMLVPLIGFSQQKINTTEIKDFDTNVGLTSTVVVNSAKLTEQQSKDSFLVSFYESNGQYIMSQGANKDTVGVEVPNIGDRYAGGDVFYIHSSGTWGYCASPTQLTSLSWAPEGYSAGYVSPAVQYGFGYGEVNTGYIVDYWSSTGTDFAAYACDTLVLNGYNDWFLPSVGDYDTLYVNLIDGFGGTSYAGTTHWTSSESSSLDSRTFDITTGLDSYIQKYNDFPVIPIRMFSIPATAPSGGGGIESITIVSSDLDVNGSPTSGSTPAITLNLKTSSVQADNLNDDIISGQSATSSIYDSYLFLMDNGTSLNKVTASSNKSYLQTNWSYPVSSSSTLGCVYTGSSESGTIAINGVIAQSDNNLGLSTPTITDKIGFWDNDANAQKYCLIEDLPISGGSSLTVKDSDGSPSYSDITTILFNGATLAQSEAGSVKVSISSSGSTDLGVGSKTSTTLNITSSSGSDATVPQATTTEAGLLNATDKVKLNTIKSTVPQSFTTSIDASSYLNFYTTVSADKTITFSNVDDGDTGNFEVIYSASSEITIAEDMTGVTTIKIAPSLEGTASNKIATKSSGEATYSYWRRGTRLYIVGTKF